MKINTIYILVIFIILGVIVGINILKNKSKSQNLKENDIFSFEKLIHNQKLNTDQYYVFDYLPTNPVVYLSKNEFMKYKDFNKDEILNLINNFKSERPKILKGLYLDLKEEKNLIVNYLNKQIDYIFSLPEFDKKLIETYKKYSFALFTSFLNKFPLNRLTPLSSAFIEIDNLYNLNPSFFQSKSNLRIIMNNLSEKLNNIILNAPSLPMDIFVYRGTREPYYMNNLVKDNDGSLVYNINSFHSTSLLENIATKSEFINKTCCMNIIKLPKGVKTLYMYIGDGRFIREQELLLPIGGKLKFISYIPEFKQFEEDNFQTNKINGKYIETDKFELTKNKLDTYIWEYIPPSIDYVYKELFLY